MWAGSVGLPKSFLASLDLARPLPEPTPSSARYFPTSSAKPIPFFVAFQKVFAITFGYLIHSTLHLPEI